MSGAEVDHSARAHAIVSASGVERMWNCLGSLNLVHIAQAPNRTSVYAEEGTAAHEVANLCLESGQDAIEYVDRVVNNFTVTAEMADAVQVYLDDCRATPVPQKNWMIESRVSLSGIAPIVLPGQEPVWMPKSDKAQMVPMFGTTDFGAHATTLHRLYVKDYKHGAGVPVAAKGSGQLRYYALGTLMALPPGTVVNDVELTIVQPRAPGDAIKRETVDVIDLMEWGLALVERVKLAMKPDAPLTAGKWCRFCPAAGACPEQANKGLRAAQMDFANMVDPLNALTGDHPKPPEIRLLTKDEIGSALSQADALEDWIKSLRAAACDTLARDEVVPGWKLVAKRATKKWNSDDDTTGSILVKSLGLDDDDVFKRKIVTPTQAEAALVKQLTAKKYKPAEAKAQAKELLSDMYASVSSGPTLAPEGDARPAIAGRGSEFHLDQPDPE